MPWWPGYWDPWAWRWPWYGGAIPYATPWGTAPYGAPWGVMPKEQEIAVLEEQARLLEGQLTEVRRRLEELQR